MVIDLILDRKDGTPYNAHDFYISCMGYHWVSENITRAMDYGTNEDVREALCAYILEQDYNPDICKYIRSVDWLTDDKLNPMCYGCKVRGRCVDGRMCHGTTNMVWTGCVWRIA